MLTLARTAESAVEAYDLWVQTPERDLLQEPVLVLGCRDEKLLLKKLNEPQEEHRLRFDDADPNEIRSVITRYWDNHIKFEKVVYRHLILTTARDGMRLFGSDLLRLYFVLATGKDCGPRFHSPTDDSHDYPRGADDSAALWRRADGASSACPYPQPGRVDRRA